MQQLSSIDQFIAEKKPESLKLSSSIDTKEHKLRFECPRYLGDLKEELEQWREEKSRSFSEGL